MAILAQEIAMPLHRHSDCNLIDPIRTVAHAAPPSAGAERQKPVEGIEQKRKLALSEVIQDGGALMLIERAGKVRRRIPKLAHIPSLIFCSDAHFGPTSFERSARIRFQHFDDFCGQRKQRLSTVLAIFHGVLFVGIILAPDYIAQELQKVLRIP